MTRLASLVLAVALGLAGAGAPAQAAPPPCGEPGSVAAHGGTTMRYAYSPASPGAPDARTTLVLLAGGAGFVDLDDKGCPRKLTGNSLVRSIPLFNAAGFATALVDAPTDYQGEDGLAAFRAAPDHAADLGALIAALRVRTGGAVWVAGTSRGTISAANAAARNAGAAAPDGAVLTSNLTVGTARGRKAWTAQTVFDVPLEAMRVPVLLLGHADDKCLRSPPGAMAAMAERIGSPRKQSVVVSGGDVNAGPGGLEACEGRSPHGFDGLEAEVAAGIARFVRGGAY